MNEHFLVAYVSEDTRVIGLDHSTDADWKNVLAAQIALRDHLNWRIKNQDKCPYCEGD